MSSKDAIQPLSNEELAAMVGGFDQTAYSKEVANVNLNYRDTQASVVTGALLNQFGFGSSLSGLTGVLTSRPVQPSGNSGGNINLTDPTKPDFVQIK